MAILVRAAVLLAITAPLFAASDFHLPVWLIFVAALIGSALGQLALYVTRGGPRWIRIVLVVSCFLEAAGAWVYFYPLPGSHAAPAKRPMIVVENGRRPTLTLDDARALERSVAAAAVAPVEHTNAPLATEAGITWETNVVGTTPSYLDVRGWRVAKGDPFPEDRGQTALVVVLGPTTAKHLFGDADPVGQIVRLKTLPMTVVGILGHTGDPDADDTAILPLSTFEQKVAGGARFGGRILIRLHDGATSAPIRELLRERHFRATYAEDDFVVREPN